MIRALTALAAVALLLGPGVHRLPGFGHSASKPHPACEGSDRLALSGDSHASQPDASGDDCPVCHALSQATALDEPAALPDLAREVGRDCPIPTPVHVFRRHTLLPSRGPPRPGLASVVA